MMLSNKPYLLRAFYEWIVDSACTPLLVLDATHPHCNIPEDYAEGGEIIFNVAPSAVRDWKISNDMIAFKASFSGVIHFISAPMAGILSIYAEENGEGLFFEAEEENVDVDGGMLNTPHMASPQLSSSPVANTAMSPSKGKPVLTLVD